MENLLKKTKKTCNRYFEKGKMKFNNVKPILNLTLLNSILYMTNRGFNNVKPMLNLTLLNSILYVPNRGFNIVKPMLNLTLLNSILFVFYKEFNIVKPMLNLTMLNFIIFNFLFCFFLYIYFFKNRNIFLLYICTFLSFNLKFYFC